MQNSLPSIGMRNVKTAIAVFISLMIYDILPDREAVYACLAAIMCVQPTVGSSFTAGFNRVLGTCLGGLGGYLFIIISRRYFEGTPYNIIIALGIMILIYSCKILKRPEAASMSCVVFIMICLSDWYHMNAVYYTINRVFDTTIGIVIALMVNKYINIKHKEKDINNTQGGELK